MASESGESIHGKVYKIVSSETDKVYIGSTIRPLYERLSVHKEKYKLYLKGEQHYVTSFEIVKFSDARIELLHEDLFASKADLHRLEGQYMLSTDNCVNKCIAGRTSKERYLLNAENIKQYQVEYRKQNKEKINEQRRKHREEKADNNKQRKQQLMNDQINSHEEIEKRSRTIQCPICKAYLRYGGKARHEKTTKHINSLSKSATDASSNSTITD
jgi:hypothetical protein